MITAQLATIPGRIESVKLTIESLLPQVDRLNVMLNRHTDGERVRLYDELFTVIVKYGQHKLWFTQRQNQMGDAEKFYNAENLTGYVLTCDDDLIYPPDYAKKMIEAVDRYDGKALVSLHGRELRRGRISSYYAPSNRIQAFHCLHEQLNDHEILNGTIGTGVLAWNADKVKVYYDWFKHSNMADIWLAVTARRLGIPLIVSAHGADWLKVGYDGEDTIWHKHFNDDGYQTGIWNNQFK